MTERPLYTNRLIDQKSPYLLQHAHNPVDWFPWGEEAFQMAKDQDKPIFLSIGYATCHWCHVMEKEVFENVEVAQLLNRICVNIKVDRDELPDVDSLYMEFAQSMMGGAAGWPLNIFLTPELQPFFATTYLPAKGMHGLMGLTDLLRRIEDLWKEESREKILVQAQSLVELFSENVHSKGEEIPLKAQIDATVDLIYKLADPVWGGLKGSPKFPIGYQYSFLLRYYKLKHDYRALFWVDRTLEMICRGGIYDHLGGGFSRYSVDEKWMIPHFEKMLYDNALLAQAYMEAWQVTTKPLYKEVCEESIDYILREMTHPEGGFYSAEDADSEGREGKFYTWSVEEVSQLLGTDASLFCEYYGILPQGNFAGKNVLHIPVPFEEFCAQHYLEEKEYHKKLQSQKKLLWEAREHRVHPFKDDKIITSWNALMIHTLAQTSVVLNHKTYLEAALKAASFIKTKLWDGDILYRRWRDGQAMYSSNFDEYAFMIRAALTLFELEKNPSWLDWARQMTQKLKEQYKEEGGAFYQTDGSDENIIIRRCLFSDGAEPSGNSVHSENLLRLYQITGEKEYLLQAEDIFKAASAEIESYPIGYCYLMMSLMRYFDL